MKYKIITTSGIVDAIDAVPFRFKSPKWLAKIQLFTNRHIANGRLSKKFTVTEVSTGMQICPGGSKTRKQAKSDAQERFLLSASRSGIGAIKKVIRENALPK